MRAWHATSNAGGAGGVVLEGYHAVAALGDAVPAQTTHPSVTITAGAANNTIAATEAVLSGSIAVPSSTQVMRLMIGRLTADGADTLAANYSIVGVRLVKLT